METEPLEQPKLKLGPYSTVAVGIISFIGGQLFAALVLLYLVPVIFHGKFGAAQEQAYAAGLAGIFTILIIWLVLKNVGNKFSQIGLGRPKIISVAYAVAGFLGYLASYLLIVSLIKALVPSLNLEQEQELGFDFSLRQDLPFFIFSLIIVAPLVEEILMRGFLFSGLRTKLSFWGATVITSTLFAAAHLPEGANGLLWVGAIDTFVLSVVLCYLREKTGSLWAPILVHAMKNSMALIFLVYLR